MNMGLLFYLERGCVDTSYCCAGVVRVGAYTQQYESRNANPTLAHEVLPARTSVDLRHKLEVKMGSIRRITTTVRRAATDAPIKIGLDLCSLRTQARGEGFANLAIDVRVLSSCACMSGIVCQSQGGMRGKQEYVGTKRDQKGSEGSDSEHYPFRSLADLSHQSQSKKKLQSALDGWK